MDAHPVPAQRPAVGRRSLSAEVYRNGERNEVPQRPSSDAFSSAALYTEPPPPYEFLSYNRALPPAVVTHSIPYTAPRALLSRPAEPPAPPPCAHRARFERHGAQMRSPLSRLLSSMVSRVLSSSEPATIQNKFRKHKLRPCQSDLIHREAANIVYTPVIQHPMSNPSGSQPPLTNACRGPRDLYSMSEIDSASREQNERSEHTRAAGNHSPPPPTTEETKYCHKCQYSFCSSRLLELHLLLIHGPPSYNHRLSHGRSYYT